MGVRSGGFPTMLLGGGKSRSLTDTTPEFQGRSRQVWNLPRSAIGLTLASLNIDSFQRILI
ncbi:hypothetical protein JJD41_16250 [Oxynema sp. CENA135]|uniref:hypothetical protein n=1 Tax=Oxynema sp. CENA135 TaxID=984206 RepID=UPI00190BA943|nr:hypothetical protein [Oxynema sp. CENA135]MBK4731402.1 hypothetical protein [Oxynema sp. CENA135]